jgi:hypothetical protein
MNSQLFLSCRWTTTRIAGVKRQFTEQPEKSSTCNNTHLVTTSFAMQDGQEIKIALQGKALRVKIQNGWTFVHNGWTTGHIEESMPKASTKFTVHGTVSSKGTSHPQISAQAAATKACCKSIQVAVSTSNEYSRLVKAEKWAGTDTVRQV